MADQDLIKLYSQKILALAADIPLLDRLESPDATVQKRSPLCGSTITIDMNVVSGKVTAYGQDVKACALGQAAASVVGSTIVGRTETEIETARNQLLTMLKDDGPAPTVPFDGFEVLIPAKDYKNRHASIMLAIEASLEAIRSTQKNAATQ